MGVPQRPLSQLVWQQADQLFNIFHSGSPAGDKPYNGMAAVIWRPDTKDDFFSQLFHYFVFQDDKNLVGRSVHIKTAASFPQCLSQPVGRPDGVPADFQVQAAGKEGEIGRASGRERVCLSV